MLALDLNILWTFINIIVLFLLLKKFLFKPIAGIMEKREQLIKTSLDNARDKENEALSLRGNYENEIKESKNKAEEIINEARKKAKIEYDRIIDEAKLETSRVYKTAEKNMELQRQKEMEEMQNSIVDLAVAIAKKASQESIDEEKSKKILLELVMKAGV